MSIRFATLWGLISERKVSLPWYQPRTSLQAGGIKPVISPIQRPEYSNSSGNQAPGKKVDYVRDQSPGFLDAVKGRRPAPPSPGRASRRPPLITLGRRDNTESVRRAVPTGRAPPPPYRSRGRPRQYLSAAVDGGVNHLSKRNSSNGDGPRPGISRPPPGTNRFGTSSSAGRHRPWRRSSSRTPRAERKHLLLLVTGPD
jgi:hypothetical protein